MILITGAAGFIGHHVVRALRTEDRPVRAFVREQANTSRLKAWGCEIAVGDMTDPESLRRAVEGCEIVVHLVAIIQGKPREFERVMEEGARSLVGAAQEAGARRFVLMSALGTTERTKDVTPYFHAKWDNEQAVKESGLEHVIFRPSFVFGPDGGALQQFKRIAKRAPVTPIVGTGRERIQPIWAEDVARYFAEAIDRPDAAGRTFELGGPDVVTWNEFWERLKKALGVRRPTLHIPMGLMRVQADVFSVLPKPPVTRDQLAMIEAGDYVVTNTDAVDTFAFPLVPLDEQLRRSV